MKTEVGDQRSEVGIGRMGPIRPMEVARALYAERGWSFEDTLLEYLRSDVGHIYKGPAYFMLLRPVMLESGAAAWHVDVAVGKLETLLALMPFELPFISFHRAANGGLKVYETARLRARSRRSEAGGRNK